MRRQIELGLLCGVLRLKKIAVYWLPVIVWLFVISAASGDQKSFQRSSRIIGPLIHWLFPQLSNQEVMNVVTCVRKGAHMAEFGVLALLFWRALRQSKVGERLPWSWRDARNAWFCAAASAIADELHQTLVPSRQGSAWDVLIDCIGAAIALSLLWLIGRRRNWWQTETSSQT